MPAGKYFSFEIIVKYYEGADCHEFLLVYTEPISHFIHHYMSLANEISPNR
jgi:hypothetical protein